MKIINAPDVYDVADSETTLFLAGGIQGCKEWQKEFIRYANTSNPKDIENLIILNPRRDNFPIHDPNAAKEQIEWEFNNLNTCDIFSMYFDGPTASDQPICFYELGRYVALMQSNYPDDFQDRVVITCSPNFKRHMDVVIQCELIFGENIVVLTNDVKNHFDRCVEAYKKFDNYRNIIKDKHVKNYINFDGAY